MADHKSQKSTAVFADMMMVACGQNDDDGDDDDSRTEYHTM